MQPAVAPSGGSLLPSGLAHGCAAIIKEEYPMKLTSKGRLVLATAVLVLTAATALVLKGQGAEAQGDQPPPIGPVGLTLTPILDTSTTFSGQPIHFPQGPNKLVAVLAEVAPGGQVGRHMHLDPLFVYILEGTLTIEMEGHGTHAFRAGEGLAEVVNTWHNGRNLGDTAVKFLIVFAAQEGTPTIIRP
jgi:quercetin dioxygenase-like cupin family protein